MVDRGWVQSMQNADNIYIITEGGPKETKFLPTRESTTSLIWISMVYCDKTDGGKTWFSSCGILILLCFGLTRRWIRWRWKRRFFGSRKSTVRFFLYPWIWPLIEKEVQKRARALLDLNISFPGDEAVHERTIKTIEKRIVLNQEIIFHLHLYH